MDPSAEGHAVTLVDWSHGLILTVRCPDRAGIVAQLAASIQAAGGNIVELDQHTDVVDMYCDLRSTAEERNPFSAC